MKDCCGKINHSLQEFIFPNGTLFVVANKIIFAKMIAVPWGLQGGFPLCAVRINSAEFDRADGGSGATPPTSCLLCDTPTGEAYIQTICLPTPEGVV